MLDKTGQYVRFRPYYDTHARDAIEKGRDEVTLSKIRSLLYPVSADMI